MAEKSKYLLQHLLSILLGLVSTKSNRRQLRHYGILKGSGEPIRVRQLLECRSTCLEFLPDFLNLRNHILDLLGDRRKVLEGLTLEYITRETGRVATRRSVVVPKVKRIINAILNRSRCKFA